MGKSIRSKRMKKLRTLKREKLAPRETILLEQRAAIISTIKGEEVDESKIPQLPEDANAVKRFVHTRDGSAPKVHTLKSRYGHLVNNNTCITKFNTLEALSEKYDKVPAVKVEESALTKRKKAAAERAAKALPSTMTRRHSGRSGRDRTAKSVTSSTVKQEDEDMEDAGEEVEVVEDEDEVDPTDIDRDQIKYGEFGKPAHTRRSVVRSKLSRKRAKSVGKNGFLNWHSMAASS